MGSVLAEFFGGVQDGHFTAVPDPPPEEYSFHVFELCTREEIDRGDPPGVRLAVYRLARDAQGVPWFTARAQVRYDWQGGKEYAPGVFSA